MEMLVFDDFTKRRLRNALSAQVYSQLVTIASQISLVPILIWSWGTEKYGLWLILSAVPTFLTFSDFGFTFVAKNEMVMSVSAGYKDRALNTFHSILVFLSIALPALLFICCIILFFTPIMNLIGVKNFGSGSYTLSLFLLIVNVAMYQLLLLVCAGIRSENRPSQETFVAATSRLLESASIAISAALGADILIVAFMTVLARAVSLICGYIWMRRLTPWLYAGVSKASLNEVRRLTHPALAYMLIPISQAALIQGPVIMLGMISSPISVVIFSTSRTLARIGTSFVNVVNNTFVTEYANVSGQNDMRSYHNMKKFHLKIIVILSTLYGILLSVFSSFIMEKFTHGAVPIVQPFFFILTLAVIAEMVWSAEFTPLVAINRHRVATYTLGVMSILSAPICYVGIQKAGLSGAAVVILMIHGVMIIICAAMLRKPFEGARYERT